MAIMMSVVHRKETRELGDGLGASDDDELGVADGASDGDELGASEGDKLGTRWRRDHLRKQR